MSQNKIGEQHVLSDLDTCTNILKKPQENPNTSKGVRIAIDKNDPTINNPIAINQDDRRRFKLKKITVRPRTGRGQVDPITIANELIKEWEELEEARN